MELILLNDGLYSLVSVTKEMMANVKIMEVSTPHLDDVVRLEDDYKRV